MYFSAPGHVSGNLEAVAEQDFGHMGNSARHWMRTRQVPGQRYKKKRQKHVQKWALKWNHTFGRPAVAQRIASRLLFGGTNRRKESCFWHFFNCFWLHPWVFGGPLARFRCLAWLEIENPSCFLNKISYTLILLIFMSKISVYDLFCQKHDTFWLLELSSAGSERFPS